MTKYEVGDIIEGTVVRVYPKYAILLFDEGETGLLHISELSQNFVRNFTGYVQVGNIYKVKVVSLDASKGSMKVSIKQLSEAERHHNFKKKRIPEQDISFENLGKKLPEWIQEETIKDRHN